MTTDAPARTRQRIFPSTWAALAVSVVAAASMWSFVTGLFASFTEGWFAEVWTYDLGIWVTLALGLIGIIMNLAVGTSGGINRVVGVIGGVILLSPVLGGVGASLISR